MMFLLQERNPNCFHSMCALAPAFDWDRHFADKIPAAAVPANELVTLAEGLRLPAGLLRSMATHHIVGRPYSLKCTAHIIHGKQDQYDRIDLAADVASSLGDRCTLEMLEDDHRVAKLGSEASLVAFARWLRPEIERVSLLESERAR